MVNATQMAKPFKAKPDNWLRNEQTQRLIKVLSVSQKCDTVDLVKVRQGGKNQGTWLHKSLALVFAQWLSPEFYLACNDKLEEMLAQQVLYVPAKYGVYPIINDGKYVYCYTDAIKSLGGSTRSSASRRKLKHPQHFVKLFGRNFITKEYFDMLYSYYSAKQLMLAL